MISPEEDREYTGTVIFITILNIKALSPKNLVDSLSNLNNIVGCSSLITLLGSAWSGSTPSGLFIFVPNESDILPHNHFLSLFEGISQLGVETRCGVTAGTCVCFADVDEGLNFIGQAINYAARLAYAPENTFCIVEESYFDVFGESVELNVPLLLKDSIKVAIKGKSHDATPFRGRILNLTFSQSSSAMPHAIEKGTSVREEVPTLTGLVISYDLPYFSSGDLSVLLKRVSALVAVLRRLKVNNAALQQSKTYFSPGGDGGTLIITGSLAATIYVVTDLVQRLTVESELKHHSITVNSRVGVHYGVILLYRSMGDKLRPTGRACFVAEDIISDEEAKKWGLIYSGAVESAISNGSEEYLDKNFKTIPSLLKYDLECRRYTPRPTQATSSSDRLMGTIFSSPLGRPEGP